MRNGLIVVLGLFLLCAVGCQPGNEKPGGMEVVIDGGGEFPAFLVGTWVDANHGWEFVFEPDGKLSSAVLSMGRTRVVPRQMTHVKLIDNGFGEYTPGDWLVQYSPDTRELTVQIAIRKLYIEMPPSSTIDGKSQDVFVGAVAEDGERWETIWSSYPYYVANTKQHEGFVMKPEDPELGYQEPAVFIKAKPAPTTGE